MCGSRLVITHLAFSGLIAGDDHVVLITCSISRNVNKGLNWRPVTRSVWVSGGVARRRREGGKSLALIFSSSSSSSPDAAAAAPFDLKQSNCGASTFSPMAFFLLLLLCFRAE